MKILLATESYYPNIDGGAIAQHRLVKELVKRGHDVSVIAPNKTFKNTYEFDQGSIIYRSRGIILPFYMNNTYHFSPFPFFYINSLFKKIKPDIVNVCSPYPISLSVVILARKYKIPIVGSIHILPENMLSPFMGKFYYTSLKKYSWKYLICFYNLVDHITVPTKTGLQIYENKGLKTKATPISNGISTHIFNTKNDGRYLRKKYNLPTENIVLYTGRICAEKNLEMVIHSIPKIVQNIPIHFVFCGSGGAYKTKLKKLAYTLGIKEHITFINFLDWKDYPNIYDIADVFLMPAEAELQSIATLEALASSLPVVVVNKGAVPELASNNNGLLFESGDTEQLSQHIITLLSDKQLRKTMGENSLKLIQKHSMRHVVNTYEQVYENIINKNRMKK